jgi:hypothetical protein
MTSSFRAAPWRSATTKKMLPGGPYRYAPPITYGAVSDCVIRGALPPSLTMKEPMSGAAGSPGNGVFESSPPDRRFDVSRSSVHVPPTPETLYAEILR